jgi:ubiquitin
MTTYTIEDTETGELLWTGDNLNEAEVVWEDLIQEDPDRWMFLDCGVGYPLKSHGLY